MEPNLAREDGWVFLPKALLVGVGRLRHRQPGLTPTLSARARRAGCYQDARIWDPAKRLGNTTPTPGTIFYTLLSDCLRLRENFDIENSSFEILIFPGFLYIPGEICSAFGRTNFTTAAARLQHTTLSFVGPPRPWSGRSEPREGKFLKMGAFPGGCPVLGRAPKVTADGLGFRIFWVAEDLFRCP